MRDKYNLNLLPKDSEEAAEYEEEHTSSHAPIPGMGFAERQNGGLEEAVEPEIQLSHIPGLGFDRPEDEGEGGDRNSHNHNRDRKVPFAKPIPKKFQAQWNSSEQLKQQQQQSNNRRNNEQHYDRFDNHSGGHDRFPPIPPPPPPPANPLANSNYQPQQNTAYDDLYGSGPPQPSLPIPPPFFNNGNVNEPPPMFAGGGNNGPNNGNHHPHPHHLHQPAPPPPHANFTNFM